MIDTAQPAAPAADYTFVRADAVAAAAEAFKRSVARRIGDERSEIPDQVRDDEEEDSLEPGVGLTAALSGRRDDEEGEEPESQASRQPLHHPSDGPPPR